MTKKTPKMTLTLKGKRILIIGKRRIRNPAVRFTPVWEKAEGRQERGLLVDELAIPVTVRCQ